MKTATPPQVPGWHLETALWQRGCTPVAGLDEAGRGALAGPVVAAAVLLPVGDYPFRDSKTLVPAQREVLAAEVKTAALAWAVGLASAQEVDEVNVLQATHLASYRALDELQRRLGEPLGGLVTDYLSLEPLCPVLAVAKGEAHSLQVAAASLVAKTHRDALMVAAAQRYPQYGFDRHKGYGSAQHLDALTRYGPCELHRHSFRPVTQRTVPKLTRA